MGNEMLPLKNANGFDIIERWKASA